MNNTKTTAEIKALIKDWEEDPCWDLEDTEGFEAHVVELRKHRIEKSKEWRLENKASDYDQCARWGCSPQLLEVIQKQRGDIDRLETQIEALRIEISNITR